jgi:hypothetical protein
MSSIGTGLVIPDLWQQEAVRALQQGKDVVVQAPTAWPTIHRKRVTIRKSATGGYLISVPVGI